MTSQKFTDFGNDLRSTDNIPADFDDLSEVVWVLDKVTRPFSVHRILYLSTKHIFSRFASFLVP